jgi:hypothetical protein
MITLTTDVPCELSLKEIVVDDPVTFDTKQQHTQDAVEPLGLRAGQVYDFDSPTRPASERTPDENFGIFAIKAFPQPGGKTTHQITTAPAATRVVFERPGDVASRSTTVPVLKAGETIYAWLSDGTRFPST